MTTPHPFTPGFSDALRSSVTDALIRQGLIPTVHPVTATVTNGNPALVARLLDPRDISDAEWAEIERNL